MTLGSFNGGMLLLRPCSARVWLSRTSSRLERHIGSEAHRLGYPPRPRERRKAQPARKHYSALSRASAEACAGMIRPRRAPTLRAWKTQDIFATKVASAKMLLRPKRPE